MTPHDLVLFLRWRYDPRYAAASDGQLLDRYFVARDEAALCALVARHAGQLFNLCRVEVGDLDLAEDAFQETILALHRDGRALRNSQAVLGWLLTTARRVCGALRKQHARRTAAEVRAAVAEPTAADPADAVSREEQRRRVARAVGRLPDRYGVPLHLGLHGLSPEQIAAALNLPVPTVKTRITRGRKLLLGKLQAEGLGAVAGVWLAEQRAQAVPAGLIAAAVQAVAAGKKPAVALAAAAWWLWPGVAMIVLAGAVGTGLAVWPAAVPPPDETAAEVRETEEERDLRLLRDEVAPKLIEALRPVLVFGKCDVTVTKTEVTADAARIELLGKHQLGFQSVLHARYSRHNGGLNVHVDRFASGDLRCLNLDAPIKTDLPGVAQLGLSSTNKMVDAFRGFPYRLPPILPPGADSEFVRTVRPFLGVWKYMGDRRRTPEVLYIDHVPDRVAYLDHEGNRHYLGLSSFEGIDRALHKPGRIALALAGPRLYWPKTEAWWERDDTFGPPP